MPPGGWAGRPGGRAAGLRGWTKRLDEAAPVEEQRRDLRVGARATVPGSVPVPSASTRPTTMRWSPPVCTAWIVQSIQAAAPARRGEPETGAASYPTPANLSAPLTANPRHRSP